MAPLDCLLGLRRDTGQHGILLVHGPVPGHYGQLRPYSLCCERGHLAAVGHRSHYRVPVCPRLLVDGAWNDTASSQHHRGSFEVPYQVSCFILHHIDLVPGRLIFEPLGRFQVVVAGKPTHFPIFLNRKFYGT